MTNLRKSMLALMVLAGGCGARFDVTDRWAQAPEKVRVEVDSVGPGSFSLQVINLSHQPLKVNRDAVVLVTPHGARKRVPGGIENTYLVPPAKSDLTNPEGRHLVDVSYETGDLRVGDQVTLAFDGVFALGDAPVPVSPLKFVVKD